MQSNTSIQYQKTQQSQSNNHITRPHTSYYNQIQQQQQQIIKNNTQQQYIEQNSKQNISNSRNSNSNINTQQQSTKYQETKSSYPQTTTNSTKTYKKTFQNKQYQYPTQTQQKYINNNQKIPIQIPKSPKIPKLKSINYLDNDKNKTQYQFSSHREKIDQFKRKYSQKYPKKESQSSRNVNNYNNNKNIYSDLNTSDLRTDQKYINQIPQSPHRSLQPQGSECSSNLLIEFSSNSSLHDMNNVGDFSSDNIEKQKQQFSQIGQNFVKQNIKSSQDIQSEQCFSKTKNNNNMQSSDRYIKTHEYYEADKFKSSQQFQDDDQFQTFEETPPRKIKSEMNSSQQMDTLNITTNNSSKKKKLERLSASPNKKSVDIFSSIKKSLITGFRNTFNIERERQMCDCDIDLEKELTCPKAYEWLQSKYNKKDLEYFQRKYQELSKLKRDPTSEIQIGKDLPRTYPGIKYFQEGNPGFQKLENVLNVFALYDPDIGYVQGMNFICGIFVFHAEEHIAFWLLVMVFERFEMRDIYKRQLPGLKKHIMIIEYLINTHLPDIYEKFQDMGVLAEMYCSPWLFSLFGVLIPMENFVSFYDKFLEQGWSFFYKIILSMLENYQEVIQDSDLTELLILLTHQNYKCNLKKETDQEDFEKWETILKDAEQIVIDYYQISRLLNNFDEDNLRFTVKIDQ